MTLIERDVVTTMAGNNKDTLIRVTTKIINMALSSSPGFTILIK